MAKVTCVAVITGLTWVPADAMPAELATEPATMTVASDNANRRMKLLPLFSW